MKKILGVIIAVSTLAFSGAAFAEELMDSTFGNTVTIAAADGTVVVSYHFNDDGTFAMTSADGLTTNGTWALDGTNLCVTVGEENSCSEIEDRNVGDSWDETDENGNTMTISIVEGR
jgi:hypothetical protein